ncbi:MAG: hypothetical protein QM726_10570 [Chitinophagaceae bacterium]
MRFIIFSLAIVFVFSCKQQSENNCFPGRSLAKTVILVADTNIFKRYYIPDNDTSKLCPIFGGIGFVRLNGTVVHKPLKQIELSESQQKEFLKILRPLPSQTEGTAKACIPYYRHVVLFYDKNDKLIGQMQICFGCGQVAFDPEPECLNFFDNHRMEELKQFFKLNNLPIIERG